MKDFLEIANFRYAAKHYDGDKKISEQDFKDIVEAIRLTPSAVNIQAWKFIIGSSDKAKQLILPAIPDFNITRIDNCSHFIVFVANTDITDEQMQAVTDKEDADGRYVGHPEIRDTVDEHRKQFANMHKELGDFKEWTAKQVYIAFGSAVYAAASKGIDTTILEGIDFAKLDGILGLNERNLRTVGIVAFGYRKDDGNAKRPKSRLATEQLFESLD